MDFIRGVFDSYAGVVLGIMGGTLCVIVLVASMDRHKCTRIDLENRKPPSED